MGFVLYFHAGFFNSQNREILENPEISIITAVVTVQNNKLISETYRCKRHVECGGALKNFLAKIVVAFLGMAHRPDWPIRSLEGTFTNFSIIQFYTIN